MKGLCEQSNKQKDTTPKITSMEHIQTALRQMKEDLNLILSLDSSIQVPLEVQDMALLSSSNRNSHNDIATSQKEFIH